MSEITDKFFRGDKSDKPNLDSFTGIVLQSPDFESFVYRAAYSVEKKEYLSSAEFFKSLSHKELYTLSSMATLVSSVLTGKVDQETFDPVVFVHAAGNLKSLILLLALGSGNPVLNTVDIRSSFIVLMRMASAMIVEIKGVGVVHYDKFDILGDPSVELYTLNDPTDKSTDDSGGLTDA
jgi:hypothetical protein